MSQSLRWLSDELEELVCWCGITHAVPKSLREVQMKQHDERGEVMGIYCPLGHSHVPKGESRFEKMRKRMVAAEAAHDQTKAELEHTEARRRAEKAAKTRLKNRVAAGVCPCCKRSFQNLRRHIENKHPDFSE